MSLQPDVPRNRLKALLKDLGLRTKFRIHDLRHTFGTRLAECGVDPKTIMEPMGHADIKMTKRYIHTNTEKKASAVAGLSFNRTTSTPSKVG